MPPACTSPLLRGPRKGQPATGSLAGYTRHRKADEPACRPCLDAQAAASKAARTGPRSKVEKACEQCGRSFESAAHALYRFCSRKCQRIAQGHDGDRSPRVCEWGEAVFTPRRSFSKYCSSECGQRAAKSVSPTRVAQRARARRVSHRRLQKRYDELLAKIARLNRRCDWCDGPVGTKDKRARFCSGACRGRWHSKGSVRIWYRVCETPDCATVFVARSEHALYCSKPCRKAARTTDYVGARRFEIFARDDWVCLLCGDPTDAQDFKIVEGVDGRPAFVAGDTYPSIDHIVPQSLGGTHDDYNLRTAHFECNTKRGAAVELEQFAWAV